MIIQGTCDFSKYKSSANKNPLLAMEPSFSLCQKHFDKLTRTAFQKIFFYLIKQILCSFYQPDPIFTRLGHRASDFWYRVIFIFDPHEKHLRCKRPTNQVKIWFPRRRLVREMVTPTTMTYVQLGLGLWCLRPLSTIFQLFRGGQLSGADPGFVVRGGVSRRGVWGPLKVPSWSRVEPWQGAQGGFGPPEALGILGITDIYLNDNFEPTTPF